MFSSCFMILSVTLVFNSFVNCNQYLSPQEEESFLAEYEAEENDYENISAFRLQPHTKPTFYDLKICPFLEKPFIFTGEVLIKVLVVEPTNSIVLNSFDLNITDAKVTNDNKTQNIIYELRPENQMLFLNTSSTLVAKKNYDVKITFRGRLKSNMKGFYRSSYYESDGKEKYLATTQFEATSARRAFPCYDEPEHKTPFKITICRPLEYKALSNMKLESTSKPDSTIGNRVWDTFEQTPPMPTYLVAFIVADFKSLTTADNSFAVWTREDMLADAAYAFTEGPKLLKAMEKYTGVKYYLDKMDNAAIPDFEYGAMENWGLITYRDPYLLCNENSVDKSQCSERDKEMVFTVIAHEIAHQWFGNYVTMSWWESLWLNEGFATYFQYNLAHEVEPEWRLNEYFVIDVCQKALYNDGVNSPRSMTSEVITPYDILDKLEDSTVSDSKSGCVIRMLEHVVSTPIFKRALNTHLTKGFNAGGSVTPNDLWAAFDEQMRQNSLSIPFNKSIASVMKAWSENPVHPLITVQRIRNGNVYNINVTQTQYETSRSYYTISSDHEWIVPLSYTKKSVANFKDTKPTLWLFPKKQHLLENEVKDQEWIIFNIQQAGYYRVNYDVENWQLLIKQLKESPKVFHQLNRAQLIDDCVTLAIDEKLPFEIAFSLLEYVRDETDVIPLFAALRIINVLYNDWRAYEARSDLEDFLSKIVASMYQKLGSTGNNSEKEDHLTKTFREELHEVACRYKLPDCLIRARKQYTEALSTFNNREEYPAPVLTKDVYCAMLQSNTSKIVWDNLWNWLKKSNTTSKKITILSSLGCIDDEEMLKGYLSKFLEEDDEYKIHVYTKTAFKSVFSTTKGVNAGLKLAEDVVPRFSELSSNFRRQFLRILWNMKSKLKTEDHLKSVDKLILKAEKPEKKTKCKTLINLLETARNTAFSNIQSSKKITENISLGLKKMYVA